MMIMNLGVHNFSKNQGATSKSYAPGEWHEANPTLTTLKHKTPLARM